MHSPLFVSTCISYSMFHCSAIIFLYCTLNIIISYPRPSFYNMYSNIAYIEMLHKITTKNAIILVHYLAQTKNCDMPVIGFISTHNC